MALNFLIFEMMMLPFISGCPSDERNYLLNFKGSLRDPSGRLSSWHGFNCCKWKGIVCDSNSPHALGLDLKNHYYDPDLYNPDSYLFGELIHPSLFNLHHL
ncbi:hypothetical protein KI387_038102, partial [Taxus chinensis]